MTLPTERVGYSIIPTNLRPRGTHDQILRFVLLFLELGCPNQRMRWCGDLQAKNVMRCRKLLDGMGKTGTGQSKRRMNWLGEVQQKWTSRSNDSSAENAGWNVEKTLMGWDGKSFGVFCGMMTWSQVWQDKVRMNGEQEHGRNLRHFPTERNRTKLRGSEWHRKWWSVRERHALDFESNKMFLWHAKNNWPSTGKWKT